MIPWFILGWTSLGVVAALVLPGVATAVYFAVGGLTVAVWVGRVDRRRRRDLETAELDLTRRESAPPPPPPTPPEPDPRWKAEADAAVRAHHVDQVRFVGASTLAADQLRESLQFTETEIQSVLQAFEGLGRLSLTVEAQAAKTLEELLDEGSARGLRAIEGETRQTVTVLSGLFDRLQVLEGNFRDSGEANRAELGRVSEMAETIEEFFENIRMISLNLSIEASRIGGSSGGKALQVLAQRLRDYSNRAQELSSQQRAVVEGAVTAHRQGDERLSQEFTALEGVVLPLRQRVDSLPGLISTAHAQFEELMDHLATLTAEVQTMLRHRIGQLQFHDLMRQDNEHVIALLEASAPTLPPLDEATRRAELGEVARRFNRLATTSNERRVLLTWVNRHGLPADEVEIKGQDREAGHVELF